MAEEVNDERQTVPFADTLQKLQRGKTARELALAMQDLTGAVMDTGRAGSITLTLKVSKSKAGGMVEISDSWSVKAPKPDREVSMFFVDDDHNLHRQDPRQGELEFGVRVAEPVVGPKAVSE
jgi:hypothetical protein